MPQSLGSNLGESMDVCKCIVHLRCGGTLHSYRFASPLERLVEGEQRNLKCTNVKLLRFKVFYSSYYPMLLSGRSSLMVKVTDSWPGRVMSSSLVSLKTRRVWQRYTLNLLRAQMCPPVGGVPAQVSSSSFDHSSI
ncbi:hypothetical protein TNCV_1299661 [Trichonephila clavipes]|nr:hypothetical protein TNCV_1299661 [Trichonephila clavipes]